MGPELLTPVPHVASELWLFLLASVGSLPAGVFPVTYGGGTGGGMEQELLKSSLGTEQGFLALSGL